MNSPAKMFSRYVCLIAFACCCFGGATQVSAQIGVLPTIISFEPGSAAAGTPGLKITVNGALFNRISTVRWNGAKRVTRFVSTT